MLRGQKVRQKPPTNPKKVRPTNAKTHGQRVHGFYVTPDDSGGCAASTYSLVRAGSAAQVTATEAVGDYCVSVSDVGNLVAPAAFDLSVAHP